MIVCEKCWVSGRVQGVWYRGNTQDQAQQLGLAGYAHNLSDGRVEVLACGEAHAVQALKDWLWEGPSAARVTDVQCEPVKDINPVPRRFSIG
jgi:acylphosphatase